MKAVAAVRDAVKCPLIIWGCEDEAKNNEIMPGVSQALKGERCLLGYAKQENYKTLSAVCQADGHCLITCAPLDINKMMMMPVLVDAGHEAWRAKEARADDADVPEWGPRAERGPTWEMVTAVTLLQAGCDIIRMRHPKAIAVVRRVIDNLMA